MTPLKRDQFTQNMVPPLPGAGNLAFYAPEERRVDNLQMLVSLLCLNVLRLKDYKFVTSSTGIIVPEDLQFCKYTYLLCNPKKESRSLKEQ